MQKRLLSLAMMLLLVSATVGCTTVQKWAAGGAVLGASVGGAWAAHHGSLTALEGAGIGALAGGLAGALVGDQMAQNEYEALTRQLQEKDQEIASLQERVRDLERQLGAAQQEIENLKRRIKELEDQVAKLNEQLKNAGGGERVELTLLSDVLFRPGKAQLSDQGRGILNETAEKIKALGADRKVMIEGHTDSQPIRASNWKSNWELGAARSLAVVHYLISQGVEPSKLAASTYSQYEPVASNDNADGRSQNRRAVVVITVGRPYMSKGATK